MDNYQNPNQNPNQNFNPNDLNNNGYLNQPQGDYNQQSGYQPQRDYNPQEAYQPQYNYQNQGGYQPRDGYNQQGGYQPQDGYNQQGGYQPQGGYNQQTGYQQPNGSQMSTAQLAEWQMEQDERHKANTLCLISLLCHFVVPCVSVFLLGAVSGMFSSGDISSTKEPMAEFASGLASIVSGGSYIASWVLMIIARVKYKRSVFAKVIMWIYIVLLILSVVALILLIGACIHIVRTCPG